ncbi:MAG: branched-chain amino acid ABC transporter substrate-binding protein [Oricola sp.]
MLGIASVLPTSAVSQDSFVIGVSAPMSGYFDILGEQIETGVRAAVSGNNAVTLSVFDDECSPEGGAKAAEALISANVSVAIGFPCIEAFDTAMPKLAEAGIPVILVGVQADALTQEREKKDWKLLRLGPRNSDEAAAIAEYLKSAWREANFAIIDDGTLYGRQLAETVRVILEEDNLKPIFADTYRPQLQNQVAVVRRLQKAGAAHVFIGGDAFDAAVIGKDAEAIKVQLRIAGGSAFIAPPADGKLPEETVFAALPDWLSRDAASGLRDKLPVDTAIKDGYVAPAFAAVEIALAGMESRDDAGHVIIEYLIGKQIETAIGPVTFNEKGDLAVNLFEVFVVKDGRIQSAGPPDSTGAIR